MIELYNSDFVRIRMIRDFKEFLWVNKYNDKGYFELVLPMSLELFSAIYSAAYIYYDEDTNYMIVEEYSIVTDSQNGDTIHIKGSSLLSILQKRVIESQITVKGEIQAIIKSLIDSNIINPSNTKRKIPNFVMDVNPEITALKFEIDTQFAGKTLYEIISTICVAFVIGFKIDLDDNSIMHFRLYVGQDRTYDQDKNPTVVFSDGFKNLHNTEYVENITEYANVAIVGSSGEPEDKIFNHVCVDYDNEPSGLSRTEVYVEAADISQKTADGDLTVEQVGVQLYIRGIEELINRSMTTAISGEVDYMGVFKYGRDYFLGDVIQIENKYGITAKARVVEYIQSEDTSGRQEYPTFMMEET